MVAATREHGEVWTLSPSAWTMDDIPGPNVSDKLTVVSMAQMSADAYVEEPHTGDWEEVNNGFNSSLDFGWEGDGIRGHVFADETNSTIIISMKGTSVAVYDGVDTTTNDKENDNLFFSCCCGQQGSITHRKVCDCATSTYSCNDTCVTKSLMKENRYYAAARHLYSNVTELYPDSNVWMTGHSLGGAISSFLGMTYGLPTVTFEAPPDALAAGVLGCLRHQDHQLERHRLANTLEPIILVILLIPYISVHALAPHLYALLRAMLWRAHVILASNAFTMLSLTKVGGLVLVPTRLSLSSKMS